MNALLMSDVGLGLFVFLLGLLIVFLGMTVIVLVITVIGKIMKASDKKKNAKVATAPVIVNETFSDDDGRICAAIIAAISAYYFSENNNCEFKVKRIKRI